MPNREIDKLFKPESVSVLQLFEERVGGLEIPPYQRPYRWDPSDLQRLIEDVIASLNRLDEDPDAVTFIGAIITVSGVDDAHRHEPRAAGKLIDGQQRLTTLAMMAAALHQKLGTYPFKSRIDELTEAAGFEAELQLVTSLAGVTTDLRASLLGCLVDEVPSGKGAHRYLPRLVRGMADIWGRRPEEAEYLSPIAHLLFSYARAEHADERFALSKPTMQKLPEAVGSSDKDHDRLHRRFNDLRKYVRQLAEGTERDLSEVIDTDALLGDAGGLSVLFPKEDLADRKSFERLEELGFAATEVGRLVAFTRCLLDRIAITKIHAHEEAYAFELFDSLNSTGEPLTAFETFVPHVVKAEIESSGSYTESPSFGHVSRISSYIAEAGSGVQRETAQFLTSYLLADYGIKVGSNSTSQRSELQTRYSGAARGMSPTYIDEKRAATESMRDCARVCRG